MPVSMDKIIAILLEAIPPEASKEYDPDVVFSDAGLDSLDVSNFLLMVEEQFDITIPDEDIDSLNTLNEIAAYINSNPAA